MIKFSDTVFTLKAEERTRELADDALDHGHLAYAVLNLPFDSEEEGDDPGLPPGFLPPGFPPPGLLAGGIGIQIGPVTTVGQVLADMGMAPGGNPPP
jgi:hypothetical protein